MPAFSRDWVSGHTGRWLEELRQFVGAENVRGLEIGSFEGLSALWFLKHVLTHPTSLLVCIDPRPSPRFFENTQPLGHKIRFIRHCSQIALRDRVFGPDMFSFAYIDGSHRAADVLEDAVLVFRLIKPGGVIIFDDYSWDEDRPPLAKPRAGIDAFLQVFEGQYRLLHKDYQLVVAKNERHITV